MGLFQSKDGTAQGVAKARDYEILWPEDQRLFSDPYAKDMYLGSFVQAWMGVGLIHWIYNLMGPGILEMLLIRTKWLDEQVEKLAPQVKQLIILGAGYDTRGFRLDLPKAESFQVWEVDQPEVQKKKTANLKRIARTDEKMGTLLEKEYVKFVPVDFNVDTLDETLKTTKGFSVDLPSLIIMEGVTQYVPKGSLSDTLQKLKTLVAPGSILLMSYVDQETIDNPTKSSKTLVSLSKYVGEPWITYWTKDNFQSWMKDLGYEVIEDTTAKDYNKRYMTPLGREMKPEEITSVERYVTARIVQ